MAATQEPSTDKVVEVEVGGLAGVGVPVQLLGGEAGDIYMWWCGGK